jgi:NADH-quinone oxidoreductase subunit C
MTLEELGAHLDAKLGAAVQARTKVRGEITLRIAREEIVRVLTLLRDDPACLFEVLIDICGVDFPEREHRFEVVYHLLSPRKNQRIRIKCETN